MKTKKIRVMVVDDSYFMRKLLVELLETDSQIEVVCTAKDGAEAIGLFMQYQPDVITLDYNIPVFNGVELTKKLMGLEQDKLPAIIMISAYTGRDMQTTFDSLEAGAVDFIQKPSGELSLDINVIGDEIIRKVILASKAQVKRNEPIDKCKIVHAFTNKTEPKCLLIIGASTGGPPLLEKILNQLPVDLNMGVLVVQHLPKYFTESFSERLSHSIPIDVKEASQGDSITTNQVLIAPGDTDMLIEDSRFQSAKDYLIKLIDFTDKKGPHPSIDSTMISAAKVFKNKIVAVILTGMGEDGSLGVKAVKEAGGYVIAQEPSTTVIPSMPQSVIDKGYADEVLLPDDIVRKIIDFSDALKNGN